MTDPQEELLALRSDYLADVKEKVTLIRRHAQELETRRGFKTSFPVLLFLSHQLKGSGGSLGFPAITDLAREMNAQLNLFLDEDAARRPSPEELSSSLGRLADDLDRTVRENA